jgi:hypothetical protein
MDLGQKPGLRPEVQAVNKLKSWNEQKLQDYIQDSVSRIELLVTEVLVFAIRRGRLKEAWQNEGRPSCGKMQTSHWRLGQLQQTLYLLLHAVAQNESRCKTFCFHLVFLLDPETLPLLG